MHYLKKIKTLFEHYIILPRLGRVSSASFWYLPESHQIKNENDLAYYKKSSPSPFYFMNYRQKLSYSLKDSTGIILIRYTDPTGMQINPEAAFQYALGLHDQYYFTQQECFLLEFYKYANFFLKQQTVEGLWPYSFKWFSAEAPWYSALAQSRGASVMLRAWLLFKEEAFLNSAKHALDKFNFPLHEGGFSNIFYPQGCTYWEEYPPMPTGVMNGFMSALMGVWELFFWTQEKIYESLWHEGIQSLEKMLPSYTTGWWSLYDKDKDSPIQNVNSPRYHLLEIHYLTILYFLSGSSILKNELDQRIMQYHRTYLKFKAYFFKFLRKVIYK